MNQQLSPTLEDYLSAIHRLEQQDRVARPRDIARLQNVARSTVTAALQSLAGKGLINYKPYEVVTLTATGRESAEDLDVRHRVLRSFLEDVLGLDADRAGAAACGMEHAVDEEVLSRLVCFLAFLNQRPPDEAKWLTEFRTFAGQGGCRRVCREYVEQYLQGIQPDNLRSDRTDRHDSQ